MQRYRWFAAVLLALAWARNAHGQGASVYTHSACTTARAGAAVADPCADGSAVFYNPAALALHGSTVSLGGTLIAANAEFTFDTGGSTDMTAGAAIVPHLFAAYAPNSSVAFGLGIWAPYGLGTKWPISFEGRFVGYDNQLRTIYVQPTIAVQLVPDRIAVGAGIALVHSDVEIRQRLDLADIPLPTRPFAFGRTPAGFGRLVPPGTDFADSKLSVNAGSATFHFGVWASLLEDLAVGARYMHSAHLRLDGNADFNQVQTGIVLPPGNPLGLPPGTPLDLVIAPFFSTGGPLVDQGLATNISLPAQFVLGLRYRAHALVDVLADYQWIDWSTFDRAVLRFSTAPPDTIYLGWRDTDTWRLGANYRARPDLMLRGGIAYNNAATPDNGVTPLLPEADRFTFTAGGGYRLSDRLLLDGALEFATQKSRAGRVRLIDDPNVPARDVNVGDYDGHVWLGAFTLRYQFGRARATEPVVPPQ